MPARKGTNITAAVVGEGAVKPAGSPTTEVNIVLLKEQAREVACDLLEFLAAARTRLLLAGIAQHGGKPAITMEAMVNELGLPDLDEDEDTATFTPAPKPTAVLTRLDPLKAFAHKQYLNSEPVPEQYLTEYEQYTRETGQPPFNQEALINRMYR